MQTYRPKAFAWIFFVKIRLYGLICTQNKADTWAKMSKEPKGNRKIPGTMARNCTSCAVRSGGFFTASNLSAVFFTHYERLDIIFLIFVCSFHSHDGCTYSNRPQDKKPLSRSARGILPRQILRALKSGFLFWGGRFLIVCLAEGPSAVLSGSAFL